MDILREGIACYLTQLIKHATVLRENLENPEIAAHCLGELALNYRELEHLVLLQKLYSGGVMPIPDLHDELEAHNATLGSR